MIPEKFDGKEKGDDFNYLSQQQPDQHRANSTQVVNPISRLSSTTMLASDQQASSGTLLASSNPRSYSSNDIQYQPRAIAQQNNMNGLEVPLQFPSNQVYFNTPNFSPNEQFHNPNYHPISTSQMPGFQNNGSSSAPSLQFSGTLTPGTPTNNPLNKQVLSQLNFPSSMVALSTQSASFSTPNSYPSNTPYPSYGSGFLQNSEMPYHVNRSHSYGGDMYVNRHLNWTPEQQYQLQQHAHQPDLNQHRPERFTEEDIRVLKSLLFNGERVKWRYISSKLSSVSGRRATATACSKKTRDLFKLPSEKTSGSLGTSLPYVVHNTWSEIVEDS